jgi:methionyl aminopeptidase
VGLALKKARDIAGIYASGQITGKFLDEVAERVKPGITTAELDKYAAEFIAAHRAIPAFLGYRGFPASICVSINDQVVHGIPGGRTIEPGDLVSIDVGVVLDGYYSDAASTYIAGGEAVSSDVERLMKGTRISLDAGISALKPGIPLRLVSRAIENVLVKHKLGIIRELTGHGTGFQLHEEPTVYNFDPGIRRPLIEDGMVLAIEPMASLGTSEILLAADKWAYSTADGSLSAHFEHTVVCWDGLAFVLTDPKDDTARQIFGKAA